MTWAEVLENPSLQDLPFKIELNEWGQIVMSPAANNHSFFQTKIVTLLDSQKQDGEALVECSVETSKNVKVPDAVWMSSKFLAAHLFDRGFENPLQDAPELCVEVMSPSNSAGELLEKRELYLERGAQEVWQCFEDGRIKFYDRNGELPQSKLFPNFPHKIDLPQRSN